MRSGITGLLLALLPLPLFAQMANWTAVKEQTASGIVRIHVTNEVRQQSKPFRPGDLHQRLGTGFFISDDLIVTNQHVVEGARAIKVEGVETREKFAMRLAAVPSRKFDLAVLEFVDASERARFERVNGPITPLSWAQWSEAQPGERVAVLGFGFSERLVATQGIISSWEERPENLERRLRHVTLIRTDAAVNPGNSGGPVVSPNGRVVGISARYGPGENVGLLIPFVTAKHVVSAMQRVGMYMESESGIVAYNLNPVLRNTLNLSPEQGGVVVSHVVPFSPASRTGLRRWDVLTAVNGHPIKHGEIRHKHAGRLPYWFLFNAAFPGTAVAFDVLRGGRHFRANLVLTPTGMPNAWLPIKGAEPQPEWGYLGGMILAEVTPELLNEFERAGAWRWDLINDAPNGAKIYVVTDVEPGTQAMSYREYGLDLRLMRIMAIDGRPVNGNLSALLERIYQAAERSRTARSITVEFERHIAIQLDATQLASDMHALQARYPSSYPLYSRQATWQRANRSGSHRWSPPVQSHNSAWGREYAGSR